MSALTSLRLWIWRSWWGRILAEHDTEPTELRGGFLKVLVGLWLILPFQTFSGSPSFGVISVIPENLWAIFLVVIGIGHLMALANGEPNWRRWSALVGCFVWSAMGITFLWANPAGIGSMLFLVAGIEQGWVYSRIGGLERSAA